MTAAPSASPPPAIAGVSDRAGVTNSSRRAHVQDTPEVENSGVAEVGMVGVNTTRFEKRVD